MTIARLNLSSVLVAVSIISHRSCVVQMWQLSIIKILCGGKGRNRGTEMNWPQIILIIWMAMRVGISLTKHGEPKNGETSFWVTAISVIIIVFILYKGGFFG